MGFAQIGWPMGNQQTAENLVTLLIEAGCSRTGALRHAEGGAENPAADVTARLSTPNSKSPRAMVQVCAKAGGTGVRNERSLLVCRPLRQNGLTKNYVYGTPFSYPF